MWHWVLEKIGVEHTMCRNVVYFLTTKHWRWTLCWLLLNSSGDNHWNCSWICWCNPQFWLIISGRWQRCYTVVQPGATSGVLWRWHLASSFSRTFPSFRWYHVFLCHRLHGGANYAILINWTVLIVQYGLRNGKSLKVMPYNSGCKLDCSENGIMRKKSIFSAVCSSCMVR